MHENDRRSRPWVVPDVDPVLVPPHNALLVGHHSLRRKILCNLRILRRAEPFNHLTGPQKWGGLSNSPRQHGAGSRASTDPSGLQPASYTGAVTTVDVAELALQIGFLAGYYA